ncbi:hypothetical protein GCM10023081_33860 [Arthrobacter ginkgonis]|uniref:Uncharacterized protein n=1 Tax=Arthrobacter ginkgonis TaxID=1630594 RepID=A0ABP7CRP8_9MICC
MGDGSWVKKAAAIFPWAVAMMLILALSILFSGAQIGQCAEYVAETGIEGDCTIGPALNLPGAWIWGAASVVALSYCGYRILRAGRGQ